MDSAARTVNVAGVACGCAVGLAAILLFGWWLWARFARPHGQHNNLDDHTSVAQLLRQNATLPEYTQAGWCKHEVPMADDETTETFFPPHQGVPAARGRQPSSRSSTAAHRWPNAGDLALAEQPHHVLLSRVVHGLRRLPGPDDQRGSFTTNANSAA
ncbi:hypothetical protein ACIA5G_34115 [Amycolatopsis sp. NPDC051758]|uniref:hypothetical protein n=1 Tax=Amycolatopsis sp. NPDC051758 TaxID=3363935 RepID=UPI00379B5F88